MHPDRSSEQANLDSARAHFKALLAESVQVLDAIRHVRMQYGLSLIQAKEIWVQVSGIAPDLHSHQQRLLDALNEEIAQIDSKTDSDAPKL